MLRARRVGGQWCSYLWPADAECRQDGMGAACAEEHGRNWGSSDGPGEQMEATSAPGWSGVSGLPAAWGCGGACGPGCLCAWRRARPGKSARLCVDSAWIVRECLCAVPRQRSARRGAVPSRPDDRVSSPSSGGTPSTQRPRPLCSLSPTAADAHPPTALGILLVDLDFVCRCCRHPRPSLSSASHSFLDTAPLRPPCNPTALAAPALCCPASP